MNRSIFNFKTAIIFLTITIFFSGCWDQHPFERIGFITIWGIETDRDNSKMKVTSVSPITDPFTKNRSEILSTTSNLIRSSRINLHRRSAKSMEPGKLQVILYSREIAEKEKIFKINEVFERDPIDSITTWLVIVDGSTEELLRKIDSLADKQPPSTYLVHLLKRNNQIGCNPEIRIHNFDTTSYKDGVDNIAPIIKLINDGVEINGTALFSKDKMAGSLSPQDTSLLMAMMGKLKYTEYHFTSMDSLQDKSNLKYGLSAILNEFKNNISVKIIDNKPEVTINLKLSGDIDEYEDSKTIKNYNLKDLNSKMQKELSQNCNEIIGYLQNIDSDPIGIGNIIRAQHNKYWKSVDWSKAYKTAKIQVNVDLKTTEYGEMH